MRHGPEQYPRQKHQPGDVTFIVIASRFCQVREFMGADDGNFIVRQYLDEALAEQKSAAGWKRIGLCAQRAQEPEFFVGDVHFAGGIADDVLQPFRRRHHKAELLSEPQPSFLIPEYEEYDNDGGDDGSGGVKFLGHDGHRAEKDEPHQESNYPGCGGEAEDDRGSSMRGNTSWSTGMVPRIAPTADTNAINAQCGASSGKKSTTAMVMTAGSVQRLPAAAARTG